MVDVSKYSFESFANPDARGFERITEHLAHGVTHCWFIPEVEADNQPVFDVAVQCIGKLLGQCPFFEYYLVGKESIGLSSRMTTTKS